VVTTDEDFKRFMSATYLELLKKEEETRAKAKEQAMFLMKNVAGSKAAAEVEKLIAQADSLENVLDSLQNEALKSLELDESAQPAENVTDLSKSAEDAPIIRLANSILALAIKKGASDIHIEPQEKEVAVRFRIDGALQQVQVLPKKIQMGLVSRLKILSRLDIAEKRLPQDGRISVRMEERPIDFRVSTIPSKWGEKICMRILDKSNTLLGLDKLILHPEVLAVVRDMITQPYGIIYVTGPTGSGKTTTLYSGLAELNDPDVNISTAEDPIEYDLPRINQVQAHKEIGLDFARILRAFLRQDPDIILVGETRDKETAHIAVEAALTGHLVLTTLHTNDAAGAFTRLGEMGIEPFLMSSSTIGVIAQRLSRRLCQSCKEAYTPDEMSLKYMGLVPDPSVNFYRHKGCDKCSFTGFKGRVGVYEVLRMNAELRKLVAQGGKSEEIAEAAARNGMKTLKDYSVWLLQNGLSTMEEILQVVSVRE
jgi:type IV pilus assembly protein PilB